MFDLTDKRVFVTGASSGLGRHFAAVLAQAGAHVIVGARRRGALDALVDEHGSQGRSIKAVQLDVASEESIIAALDEAGDIDVLVNNAGVTNTRPVLDQSAADFDGILEVNLRGAFLMATQVARRLRDRGVGGAIVNVTSILGLRQGGQVTPYAISKAGAIQMTKQLGLELARYGIRVNALAPGYVATELNEAFFDSDAGRALVKRIPQRRLATLSDLDGPLLLLASDASSYMTGAVVTVDGGHLLSSL